MICLPRSISHASVIPEGVKRDLYREWPGRPPAGWERTWIQPKTDSHMRNRNARLPNRDRSFLVARVLLLCTPLLSDEAATSTRLQPLR